MINLSSDNFKERERAAIFNNGKAGKVEGVTLELEKKTAADADNLPDYKLFVVDENGAKVNEGFYYQDESDTKKNDILVSRVLHIARAVLTEEEQKDLAQEFDSYKKAVDFMFKLIKKNMDDRKFNVFVTYGNQGYPSQYLGLRYFDFIEPADRDESETKLFPKKNDLMERVTPDSDNSTDTSVDDEDDGWV